MLFAVEPFASKLRLSSKSYKYDWIWEKTQPTNHLNANKQPLRAYENILVFYKKQCTYNPQKTQGHTRKVSKIEHKKNCKETEIYSKYNLTDYDSTERYPRNLLKFPSDKQKCALHPTQKPIELIEYFIKTYTNENELILDNCIGSGTTAVACKNTNRNYIGFEIDKHYYDIAIKRLGVEKGGRVDDRDKI